MRLPCIVVEGLAKTFLAFMFPVWGCKLIYRCIYKRKGRRVLESSELPSPTADIIIMCACVCVCACRSVFLQPNQTVRQMGNRKSHFRDGVGSGEKAEEGNWQLAGGPGVLGWAGLVVH